MLHYGLPLSVLPSPPGIYPGLVPVVLVRVVQQLIIGRYGPLFPPPASGATCRAKRDVGFKLTLMMHPRSGQQWHNYVLQTVGDIHAYLVCPPPLSQSQSKSHRTSGS